MPPAPLLVLEGVGSGSRSHAGLITALVWVEVPAGLRLQRGLARDGVETGRAPGGLGAVRAGALRP